MLTFDVIMLFYLNHFLEYGKTTFLRYVHQICRQNFNQLESHNHSASTCLMKKRSDGASI